MSPTPGSTELHLYCILTDIDAEGKVVIANFTKKRTFSDTACVVSPGAHPFIKVESVVSYENAVLAELSNIDRALREGEDFSRHEDLSVSLLNQIIDGARNSEFLPHDLSPYFDQ